MADLRDCIKTALLREGLHPANVAGGLLNDESYADVIAAIAARECEALQAAVNVWASAQSSFLDSVSGGMGDEVLVQAAKDYTKAEQALLAFAESGDA